MSVRLWSRWTFLAGSLIGSGPLLAQDVSGEPPVVPATTQGSLVVDPNLFAKPAAPHFVLIRDDTGPNGVLTARVENVRAVPARWIGIGCSSATAVLQSQLKLEPGLGLVVEHVIPDSPAGKAGLAVHDVLLQVSHGETATDLKSVADLVKAVVTTTDDIQISVLRSGEKLSATLTPLRRPEGAEVGSVAVEGNAITLRTTDGVLSAEGNVRLNVAGPAFAVTRAFLPVLPEGVSVNITRTGTEPAQVTIRRGNDAWNATEKDLNSIPEEFRGAVAAMLNPVPDHTATFTTITGIARPVPYDPSNRKPRPAGVVANFAVPFTPDIQYFEAGPTTPSRRTAAGAPGTATKVGQHVKAVKIDRVSPAQAAEIAQRIETEMTARLDQLETLQTLNQLLEKQQQFQQLQQAAVARQEQLLQELQTKVETLLQAQQPASAEAATGAAPQSN